MYEKTLDPTSPQPSEKRVKSGQKGPRQRFLLNLGKLSLPKEEWPLLAKRIEDLVRGQRNFF